MGSLSVSLHRELLVQLVHSNHYAICVWLQVELHILTGGAISYKMCLVVSVLTTLDCLCACLSVCVVICLCSFVCISVPVCVVDGRVVVGSSQLHSICLSLCQPHVDPGL